MFRNGTGNVNLNFVSNRPKAAWLKVLGPLETEIMQIVWREKFTTVKKVHQALQNQREIAYTTVMTTMTRLAEKGVLNREARWTGVCLCARSHEA